MVCCRVSFIHGVLHFRHLLLVRPTSWVRRAARLAASRYTRTPCLSSVCTFSVQNMRDWLSDVHKPYEGKEMIAKDTCLLPDG